MSKHLSDYQFARCLAGQATDAELQHTRECSECETELGHFAESMSLFKRTVRDQVEDRIERSPSVIVPKPSAARVPMQRWVLVAAAAAVLMVLPFIRVGSKTEKFPQPSATELDPDAVMNRVSLHLARTVPAPMEPLMLGVPDINP